MGAERSGEYLICGAGARPGCQLILAFNQARVGSCITTWALLRQLSTPAFRKATDPSTCPSGVINNPSGVTRSLCASRSSINARLCASKSPFHPRLSRRKLLKNVLELPMNLFKAFVKWPSKHHCIAYICISTRVLQENEWSLTRVNHETARIRRIPASSRTGITSHP